jgi:ADP-ribose pyrophosphatase YjhB (NUDIX family)
MVNPPPIRLTARVLMLDEEDRVLLFRGQDPDKPTLRFWFPPGGGIDPGETAEEAATREVREETGLMNFELGPHIWNRRHVFTFYGKEQDVRETWFFTRINHFEINTSGFTEAEVEVILEYKWWTLAELENTKDFLTPRGLAGLLKNLLSDGLPALPITVDV